jgi:hypothetical protein
LAAGGYAASAAIKDPPPGATAICVDGTYSYSQTRSGTCSHHGGVSVWLTPSAPATTAAPTATTAPAPTTTAAQGTTAASTTSTTAHATTAAATTTSPISAPPAGVTARCKDGTYSSSQTHSGTCSHHGGVAQWLDGSGTTTVSSGGGSNSGSSTSAAGSIDVGVPILISPKSSSQNCTLAALPDRACSSGAYSSKLTKAVLCSSSFRTGDIRDVPESEKHQVEHEHGMAEKSYGSALEIDHIISLELGGSNNIANLFPERATPQPGYHVKDKLENKLHALVCNGQMTLHAAQTGIATNWETLYRQVFHAAP